MSIGTLRESNLIHPFTVEESYVIFLASAPFAKDVDVDFDYFPGPAKDDPGYRVYTNGGTAAPKEL
jgi:hypothetical protein